VNAHYDPYARIRNTLAKALGGCVYESSRAEGERVLVLEASRSGKAVRLRFLGVRRSETDAEPARGAPLTVKRVSEENASPWRLFIPRVLRTPSKGARVTIEAGSARLEIVCEDVEWWED
jgi:hypothetical protein